MELASSVKLRERADNRILHCKLIVIVILIMNQRCSTRSFLADSKGVDVDRPSQTLISHSLVPSLSVVTVMHSILDYPLLQP